MTEPRQALRLIAVVGALGPSANAPRTRILKFRYVNWRGVDHEYVVNFGHPDTDCTLELTEMGDPENEGQDTERSVHLLLSGCVISRDDDPRPDMDHVRRRSFIVSRMRNIEPVREENI